MDVIESNLPGVLVLRSRRIVDQRGFFMETFRQRKFDEHVGGRYEFVQDNFSRSKGNTLRGLHFQRRRPQGKIVRVTSGRIFDVAVNIDPASEHFLQWTGVVLSDANDLQLWIPPHHAHGFLVLSDVADIAYKCTDYYSAGDEGGIIWNDETIGIQWPLHSPPELSQKDAGLPTYGDALFSADGGA